MSRSPRTGEAFAGRVAEELTYTSADDEDENWLTRSVTYPDVLELARRDREDGLSPLRAWRVTEPRQMAYSRSSGTGDDERTLRAVETRTTYEADYGLPTHIESLGDTGKTGDESCTFAEYHHRLDKNIVGLTRQVRTSPTTCEDATFDALTTLSSGGRVAYDGTAYGTAPGATTRGLATATWSLKADGSGFQADGSTGFDAIGRVVSKTDPDGRISTITYGAASNGQTFTVTEANSLGHQQVRELEPGRAVSLKTTERLRRALPSDPAAARQQHRRAPGPVHLRHGQRREGPARHRHPVHRRPGVHPVDRRLHRRLPADVDHSHAAAVDREHLGVADLLHVRAHVHRHRPDRVDHPARRR